MVKSQRDSLGKKTVMLEESIQGAEKKASTYKLFLIIIAAYVVLKETLTIVY